jgi:DNA replication protein DnaC
VTNAVGYERTSLVVTINLPFEAWTEVCGSERLTGAILNRLTHRVHIIEANGKSYRLRDSERPLKTRRGQAKGIVTPCRAE